MTNFDAKAGDTERFLKAAMAAINADLKVSLPLVALVKTDPDAVVSALLSDPLKHSKETFDDITIALVNAQCHKQVQQLIVDDRFDASSLTYLSPDFDYQRAMQSFQLGGEIDRIALRLRQQDNHLLQHARDFIDSHGMLKSRSQVQAEYLFARFVELSVFVEKGRHTVSMHLEGRHGEYSPSSFQHHSQELRWDMLNLCNPITQKEIFVQFHALNYGLSTTSSVKLQSAWDGRKKTGDVNPEVLVSRFRAMRVAEKQEEITLPSPEWEDFAALAPSTSTVKPSLPSPDWEDFTTLAPSKSVFKP